MKRLIDLSHTVEDGLVTYEGLPAPRISAFLTREASKASYAEGTEFHIGRIDMVANTGTYVDSPFHRYSDGLDLAALPLESVADLPVRLVHHETSSGRGVDAAAFAGMELRDHAILVHTGWSVNWRTPGYFTGAPFLTRKAAELLAASGVKLVGIDSYNIDDTADRSRPAHSILLRAGIPIVEHMAHLERLPEGPLRFFAVPVKVKAFGTFPVRAFALAL